MPIENLVAFAAAAAVLIAVPGPSVLFVIGRSLALGRLGGFVSVLGNTLGVLAQIAFVAAGIGALIAQSAVLFAIVKYAGAAYLVFLGVQAIRHRREAADRAAASVAEARTSVARRIPVLRILGEGLVVGATNPKAIVFFVAVLPQFVDVGSGGVVLQLVALGGVFAVIALAFDSAWALAAGGARDWFAGRPERMSQFSVAGGAMMIGLGGVVALTGERPTAAPAR